MKEKHLAEAMRINAEIVGLQKALEIVNLGIWSIQRIGNTEEEHQYASTVLGGTEDWIQRVAKDGLSGDIKKQIYDRRMRLRELGVELEGEHAETDPPPRFLNKQAA